MADERDDSETGEPGEFKLRASDVLQAPAAHLTREGLRRLEEELENLQNVRIPEVVDRIRAIREMSADPLESGEYSQAMEQMAQLRAREAVLRTMIGSAEVPRVRAPHGIVHLGSKVTLAENNDRETYTVVGPVEADATIGRLSDDSPLGKSLMGRHVGDDIEWVAPMGVRRARILEIK